MAKGLQFLFRFLIRPEFDYVALGHVHKHQNLNPANNPPIIYPGSIDRVDFSEEKEDKGYVLVTIDRGNTEWEFCPLPVRNFCTIKLDISQQEDPQEAILDAIKNQDFDNAVVRLIYKLRSEQLELISSSAIEKSLKEAHSYTIRPELISQLARPRLPELGLGNSLDPLEALKAYLKNKEDLKELAPDMLEIAQSLMES